MTAPPHVEIECNPGRGWWWYVVIDPRDGLALLVGPVCESETACDTGAARAREVIERIYR